MTSGLLKLIRLVKCSKKMSKIAKDLPTDNFKTFAQQKLDYNIKLTYLLSQKMGYGLRTSCKLTFVYSHQNPKVSLNHLIWVPLLVKMKN